jgi:gluconokinase
MSQIQIMVVMGAAGAGKTTVGQALAADLGWPFADADAFHSPASLAKMSAGIPLTDADRAPWLDRLAAWIADRLAAGQTGVLACSALKEDYRRHLSGGRDEVLFVYLKADPALLADRLIHRHGHFAKVNLLESQLATLEEPQGAVVVDAAMTPEQIVEVVRALLEANRADLPM